jgi:TetR/AcrR family transcriptional regulator
MYDSKIEGNPYTSGVVSALSNKRRGRPPTGSSPASTDEILAAALRVFARDGYGGASVAAVNRELGVSHNLINQRFGSKEALWYAVVDWIFANAEVMLSPSVDAHDLAPLEQFRRGIVRFLKLQAKYPDVVRLISVEAAVAGQRLDYLYEHHIEPLLSMLSEPLMPLVQAKKLTRNDLRSLFFLIAHGATAPFALAPLASKMTPADPLAKSAVTSHAEFVAEVIVAGVEERARRRAAARGTRR